MSVVNNKTNSSLSSFGSSNLAYTQKQNTNTFRLNPLALTSLRNLDVDKLEDDMAKEIQNKKIFEEREKVYNCFNI